MEKIKEIGGVVGVLFFVAFLVGGATCGWLALWDKKFSNNEYLITCPK